MEAQASLRGGDTSQIDAATSHLQRELTNLTGAEPASVRGGIEGHLATLDQLRAAIATGRPVSPAEISAAVSSARSAIQQAEAATVTAQVAEAERQAEIQKRTAELDKVVAGTMEADRTNNALAHAIAKRHGVDLSDLDREREELERQRREAIGHGDKQAERHVDTLLAQNTFNALEATETKVTDPGEHAALEKQKLAQQKIIDTRAAAEAEQEKLSENAPAQNTPVQPVKVDAAKASDGFAITLDGGSSIALSDKPDAHTTVEVPQTKIAAAAMSGPARS